MIVTLTISKITEDDGRISPPEPPGIDPGRLKVTYQPGKTYVNKVIVQLTSRGSYKDWGVSTDMNFTYVGEFQLNRHIVSNDGTHLVADIQVD